MPRKIIAYACEHGCARKVLTSKKRMEEHESRCFSNPERKACRTCAHFESYHDSNGMEHDPAFLHEFFVQICHSKEEIDLSEKLRADCPFWSKQGSKA